MPTLSAAVAAAAATRKTVRHDACAAARYAAVREAGSGGDADADGTVLDPRAPIPLRRGVRGEAGRGGEVVVVDEAKLAAASSAAAVAIDVMAMEQTEEAMGRTAGQAAAT